MPDWMHLMFASEPLKADDALKVYNANKNSLEGFGEIVYFFPGAPRMFSKVDDKKALAIQKIANDNQLIIMVHPSQRQRKNLENALAKNPDATFILHGWEHDDYIWEMMEKYPNLYFTLDAATLYPEYGKIDGAEDEFIPEFQKDFNSILEADINKWKVQIERYPYRFMWGTDRYYDWHWKESNDVLFEEFGRAFIGRIDPKVQEDFAYKNAERIFAHMPPPEEKIDDSHDKNLGDLPESVRLCIINQIGENKWRELSSNSRNPTVYEEQTISQCSK